MPEICRFYGIVIKMYFADHTPPHFHAEYSEHEARIAIESLAVRGTAPHRSPPLSPRCGQELPIVSSGYRATPLEPQMA